MLPQTFESQSNLLAHAVRTYTTMLRTSTDTFTALAALQGRVLTAQLKYGAEFWQRYLSATQEAQPALLSSMQSRAPEAARSAQAATIETAQHAIEAAAAPQPWKGEERRKTTVAVPIAMERRRAA